MSTYPESVNRDGPRRADGTERVQIGRIVGAHGVGGVIRVHPTTDFPERFYDMKTLRAKARGKPEIELEVISVKPHEGKGQLLVTVRGIEDRDAAEALRGRVITVAPDERVELPEGEYWIDSLIGLDVIETGGRHLGIIEDVLTTGSSDIYQVRADDGTLKMIPAIEDVVREISLNDGAVKVDLLEGLWD